MVHACTAQLGAAGGGAFVEVLPWLGLVLALVVVGWLAITIARRFLRNDPDPAEGFTLQGLRDMRERGDLSEEEYENARQSLLAAVSGGAAPSARAAPGSGERRDERDADGGGDNPPPTPLTDR